MRPVISLALTCSLATAFAAPAFAQNDAAGQMLVQQRCKACHAVEGTKPGPLGPSLVGIFGRKAGSANFAYSPAMKRSGLKWDAATLDKYLAAPLQVVPGTTMVISVSSAKERAAIIAYLRKLK